MPLTPRTINWFFESYHCWKLFIYLFNLLSKFKNDFGWKLAKFSRIIIWMINNKYWQVGAVVIVFMHGLILLSNERHHFSEFVQIQVSNHWTKCIWTLLLLFHLPFTFLKLLIFFIRNIWFIWSFYFLFRNLLLFTYIMLFIYSFTFSNK